MALFGFGKQKGKANEGNVPLIDVFNDLAQLDFQTFMSLGANMTNMLERGQEGKEDFIAYAKQQGYSCSISDIPKLLDMFIKGIVTYAPAK